MTLTERVNVAEMICATINAELSNGSPHGWRASVWTPANYEGPGASCPVRVYVQSESRARRKAGYAYVRADGSVGSEFVLYVGTLTGIVDNVTTKEEVS